MWGRKFQPIAKRLGAGSLAVLGGDQVGQHWFRYSIDPDENAEARAAIHSEEDALRQLGKLLAAERTWALAGERGGEAGLCAAVRAAVGHSLCCTDSKVAGGGDGVFADGPIPVGSVVSVYAGAHWSAWDGFFSRIFRQLVPWGWEDGYLLRQADGSVMDGCAQRAVDQRRARGYVMPSASCQLANHPPAGVPPNAAFFSLELPVLDRYSQLLIFRWPFRAISRVVTVMVSVSDIADGEELFVDYKFEGAELPGWYTPCPGGDASASPSWKGPSMKQYLSQAEFGS